MDLFRTIPPPSGGLERCMSAMSAVKPRALAARARLRWTMRLLGATAFAGAACTVVFMPRQASAFQSLQEVLNAQNPNLFQHTKQYIVHPDGNRELITELYTAPGRYRINLPNGGKELQVNGNYTIMLPSGEVSVFHNHNVVIATVNIKKLIEQGGAAFHIRSVSVERNARFSGKKVDRYHVQGTYSDAVYKGMAYSFTLDADPGTKRPLRLLGGFEGRPKLESDFDYPSYSAKFFKLPIPAGAHVVDRGDWATYVDNLKKRSAPRGRQPQAGPSGAR
jgi:hypothetical protein